MNRDVTGSKPLASCLLAVVALLGFAAVGCSEIHSGSDVAAGDSPTQEEERQERNRRGDGGGGNGGGGY
jgi:hypothetical protein